MTFFFFLHLGERARDLAVNLRRTFFEKYLCQDVVSLVLGHGLEHSCPWPQEGWSLASNCFVFFGLGLEPCVLDSISAIISLTFP